MPIGGQKEMHSKGMEMDDEDAAVIHVGEEAYPPGFFVDAYMLHGCTKTYMYMGAQFHVR